MVREESRHPISGIDYPGTFQEFDEWFGSEDACLDYVAKIRWPQGFICPDCSEKADKPSLMGLIQGPWPTLLPYDGAGHRLSSRATQNDYRWPNTTYGR